MDCLHTVVPSCFGYEFASTNIIEGKDHPDQREIEIYYTILIFFIQYEVDRWLPLLINYLNC